MNLVKRWRHYARQYGVRGLVRYLALRLVRPVWSSASVMMLVAEPPAAAVAARAPIRIDLMSAEAARASGFMNPDWENRWKHGDVCYGAWLNGVCVHHSWVTRGDTYIGETKSYLAIGPDEAYIYDCFTAGECRGMGIFPAVLSHVASALFGTGVTRVWIAVEEENRSSLKAIQKGGFRFAGEILFRKAGLSAQTTTRHEPGVPEFSLK
ncbi:MAG TPA: GNAT family N-acetyltransferase [Symbiobacteriaceae bacterium]|nr:GNAT family N-acetyltransferase [Symbiobacteriaceae bacterium]